MAFTIGTFNAFNLVSPGVTYYGSKRYSQNNYDLKVKWIGQQLDLMNSDVVGFQEIFHEAALAEAVAKSNSLNGSTICLTEERTDSGDVLPAVALVSKLPVIGWESVTEFDERAKIDLDLDENREFVPATRFSRPVVKARIQLTDSQTATVFVAHLKSKRPSIPEGADRDDFMEQALGKTRSLIRRAAEAVALRSLALTAMQDTSEPVFVLGDLNDTEVAVSTEIVSGSPPWKFQSFEKKKKIWDTLLYNSKDIQARKSYRDVYFTHIHNGHYEALDHILMSQEFVDANPARLGRVENVRVWNDHLIDGTLTSENIPPWQSDHGLVAARIKLNS